MTEPNEQEPLQRAIHYLKEAEQLRLDDEDNRDTVLDFVDLAMDYVQEYINEEMDKFAEHDEQ